MSCRFAEHCWPHMIPFTRTIIIISEKWPRNVIPCDKQVLGERKLKLKQKLKRFNSTGIWNVRILTQCKANKSYSQVKNFHFFFLIPFYPNHKKWVRLSFFFLGNIVRCLQNSWLELCAHKLSHFMIILLCLEIA